MERMVAMGLYHAATATQQTPHQAVLALVFAVDLRAGNTKMLTKKVTMAIVTK
jgi:hypothetical protein